MAGIWIREKVIALQWLFIIELSREMNLSGCERMKRVIVM